ncbi:hypothetical protein CKY39_27140 [Variovorax boronicumulans]|uniref:DUF927 domain-containing protein n=1 Tax=Variovorax boronicumulans TaxID=436515 RepID=A0A250DRD2_9BURK|nr:DUF927 domain-containing protein [Variovorax boronicumulans]ATA56503.1 hypothetical protein CKY39_27140 [Variovorax boronicumulans]
MDKNHHSPDSPRDGEGHLPEQSGQPQRSQHIDKPQGTAVVQALAEPPRKLAPQRFHNTEDGLFALNTPGEVNGARNRVGDAIYVDALVRSGEGMEWGKLARWYDPDGNEHRQVIQLAALQGDGLEVSRALASGGLMTEPGPRARNQLLDYLASERPARRITIVPCTGWHGPEGAMAYVMPHVTIGSTPDESEMVLSLERVPGSRASAGTVEDWKVRVGRYCSGNSRLLLVCSMAFAATLLPFSQVDGGGLHLTGRSSTGKTRAAKTAGSACGGPDYMQPWRSTLNGLEAVAARHNCALLILDEIGQVDPREVGESSYMLGNGQGKQRAIKSGAAARRQSWRLLYLSTGEVGLSQHMAVAGKSVRAGQEVRLAELQADAGQGHGIFDVLHGHASGAALSDTIAAGFTEAYGEVGVEFIRRCAANQSGLRDLVASGTQEFLAECVRVFGDGRALGGQAHRVCERFALKALAGELATSWGLTGWQPGEARAAIVRCFGEWLNARGTSGDTEPKVVLNKLREFISRHEDSRFVDLDAREVVFDAPQRPKLVHNRAGWRKRFEGDEREYLIDPQVFRCEIFAGFDTTLVCRVLVAAGCMQTGEEGGKMRYTLYRHLGGLHERRRVYVITSKLWADEADDALA